MSEEASFSVEIDAAGQAVLERLSSMPEVMIPAIMRGMDRGAQLALGTITAERFTGAGPFDPDEGRLGVKTNRLRASLRTTPAEVEGDTITAQMGSNVAYFGAHEFGFEGQVQVPSFQRQVSSSQFVKTGGQISTEAQKGGKRAKRAALGKETVQAHTRHLRIPARAPLGHGLADHADMITAAIVEQLTTAWEGQG